MQNSRFAVLVLRAPQARTEMCSFERAYLEVHGTFYTCTYSHIRALKGLINGLEVQL